MRMVLGNISGSAGRVISPQTAINVGAVFVGALAANTVTTLGRENVFNVQMRGGDLIYPAVGAMATYAVLGMGRIPNMLATGMLVGGVANELGDVEVL